jgi:hypothetical protein
MTQIEIENKPNKSPEKIDEVIQLLDAASQESSRRWKEILPTTAAVGGLIALVAWGFVLRKRHD